MGNRLKLYSFAIGLAALLLLATIVRPAIAAEATTLNLSDADITTLISTVAEVTGRNFIIDPRVKGKVTVISSRPMAGKELYQIFLSILQVHGFSAVNSGKITKIVPDTNARQLGIPTGTDSTPGRGDELVTRVLEIKHVNAAQLVPILRPLIPQQSHLAAYPQSNVLILSDRADNIERIVSIIERIDLRSNDEVEVIRLEHAGAAEVVRILSSLETTQGAKGAAGSQAVKFIADERTNSILISGEQRSRVRLRAVIAHLDMPLEKSGNTKVIYLRYAKAKDIVPVLTGVSGSLQDKGKGGAKQQQQQSKINIQADEATNALVITAQPDILRNLEAVIRQLDIRRAQVLVEAIIAEVEVDTAKELGIQWIVDGRPEGSGPVGISNFNGSGSGIAQLAVGATTGAISVGDGLTMGFGQFEADSLGFVGIVRALAGNATTNVLSTPSLVTMDNEEAEIVVGQNVPFVTGSFSSTGSSSNPSNPFQTIQREDIGITLTVTPQINEGDAVKLDIQQEVSSISPSSVGAADIVTKKRSIKTSVMVDDGEVVVLGGLISDDLTESDQRVPLLGDIPVLGWLFRNKRTQKIKRNLMVFLHPQILRDKATLQGITSRKYSLVRERQLAIRERGVALMQDDVSPLLPTLGELNLPSPFESQSDEPQAAPAVTTEEPPERP